MLSLLGSRWCFFCLETFVEHLMNNLKKTFMKILMRNCCKKVMKKFWNCFSALMVWVLKMKSELCVSAQFSVIACLSLLVTPLMRHILQETVLFSPKNSTQKSFLTSIRTKTIQKVHNNKNKQHHVQIPAWASTLIFSPILSQQTALLSMQQHQHWQFISSYHHECHITTTF